MQSVLDASFQHLLHDVKIGVHFSNFGTWKTASSDVLIGATVTEFLSIADPHGAATKGEDLFFFYLKFRQ